MSKNHCVIPIKQQILNRIEDSPSPKVWTAFDFLDLGKRDAINKALQRLVSDKAILRIDRGLYHLSKLNKLTNKLQEPDYREVIEAIARRDQARMLIDGLTSANDIGLTNAVPGQVNILTDCRLTPITIGKLQINFKQTAPSKLYWANRPGMRVVQALYWLRDILSQKDEEQILSIRNKLISYVQNSAEKQFILEDLRTGMQTLPAWMQDFLKESFDEL